MTAFYATEFSVKDPCLQ